MDFYDNYAGNNNQDLFCNNATTHIQDCRSLRHLGGPDTTIPAIGLYEGTARYEWGGREVYVDGVAFAELPFAPRGYAFTGNLNWTLYSGSNFDGNSTCLATDSSMVVTFGQIDGVVGSVIRGCDLGAEENIVNFKNM